MFQFTQEDFISSVVEKVYGMGCWSSVDRTEDLAVAVATCLTSVQSASIPAIRHSDSGNFFDQFPSPAPLVVDGRDIVGPLDERDFIGETFAEVQQENLVFETVPPVGVQVFIDGEKSLCVKYIPLFRGI